MQNTNVEEESSDAAAYGLVALCDQSHEGINTHFSEEVVETSGQIISSNVAGNVGRKIFLQSLSGNTAEVDQKMEDDSSLSSSTTVIILEHPSCETRTCSEDIGNYHYENTSVIAISHDSIIATANNFHAQQQEEENGNSERHDQNVEISHGSANNIKESYILASLHDVDVETVTSDEGDENTEPHIREMINEQRKMLLPYEGGVLDENYFQALKTRQALLREAIEWKIYAKMLLEKGCSSGANFYEPEVLTALKGTDDVALKAEVLSRITEKDMLQPAVQFWDFEKVYEAYGNRRQLNCPSCSMQLMFVPFVGRFALRMLYDIDRPVLLVTSFLRCQNKGKKQHEILGYDPRLLRMFPNLDLPFMLFHKAGITKHMMEFIMENVINGMTVNRLFDMVKTKYEVNHTITSQFFVNEIESIRAHVAAAGGQIEISKESLFPAYVSCHPSKALLGRCFLASFKEKDDYYKFCMQQLLANECLILDESLCVGARIGIPGIWGSTMKMFPEEYQGMFLVFNEAKHILSWSFLKDGTFQEVTGLLTELKDRHTKADRSLKACFTTKCCEWRDDLRKVFGKWFIVKGNLRLFLDRIIKEMPPDHTYYVDCVSELELVFRDVNDTGEERKDFTGDPVIIEKNLKEFIKRWKDVIDDRIRTVLTEKALQYLTELEQHIKTGCLSSIPPEVGDENFNDVHNALRKSVSHCRITVPLVSALFSMCLHEINRSKGAPVDFQYQSTPSGEEQIITTPTEITTDRQNNDQQSVSIQTDGGEGLSQLPQLVVDKQKIVPASNIIQSVHQFYKRMKRPVPPLLLQAIMYYKYEEDFDAFAPQAIKNLRLLPYYSSALNLISHPAFPKEERVDEMQVITQGLSEIRQKIRRMHFDVTSSSRLKGCTSDIFSIVARQLLKDRMVDNLSVEVLEYVKELMTQGINLLEMKEKDIVLLLKRLIDYQDEQVENAKKELFAGASNCLVLSNQEETQSSMDSTLRLTSESATTNIQALNEEDRLFSANAQQQFVAAPMEDLADTDNTKTNTIRQEMDEGNALVFSDINATGTADQMHDLFNSKSVESREVSTVQANIISEPSDNHDTQNFNLRPNGVFSERLTNSQQTVQNEVTNDASNGVSMETDELPETIDANNELIGNSDFEILKALSDKLGIIITVLTNLEHCWVIPIFPAAFHLYSPHVFIVYRYQRFFPAWLGNRASVSSIRNINLKRQGKRPQCRCGRGTPGKGEEGRCFSRENGKYLSRCICFRLDRGCSDLCDCRGCVNPFGNRPEKLRSRKAKIPYRQRYAHEAAKIATCKSSSAFATIATQTPNHPEVIDGEKDMCNWVSLEHCIFEALINEIKSDDNVITPAEVQETYNAVVLELLNITELNGIAYAKSTDQITMKLQQREKDVAEYLAIYQKQVDLSLG